MLVDHFFGVDDGTDLNVRIADDEDSAVIAFFLMRHVGRAMSCDVVRCRAMSCESCFFSMRGLTEIVFLF